MPWLAYYLVMQTLGGAGHNQICAHHVAASYIDKSHLIKSSIGHSTSSSRPYPVKGVGFSLTGVLTAKCTQIMEPATSLNHMLSSHTAA